MPKTLDSSVLAFLATKAGVVFHLNEDTELTARREIIIFDGELFRIIAESLNIKELQEERGKLSFYFSYSKTKSPSFYKISLSQRASHEFQREHGKKYTYHFKDIN